MTDSTDKKSKETRDNFEVDLDAMLDEADSTIVSNEFQDDEDAIERLLMNAGFDADDALMPAEMNKNSTFTQLNETQDYEDDLDRLVMNTALDADYAPEQARSEDIETIEEELGNFSDFNDFDEQEIVSAVKADEHESALTDDAELPDELDDFLSLVDDFDESDMIQDDEVEASAESVSANKELPIAVDESINDVQDDENSFNSLFADADFGEEDALEQAEEKKDEFGDDVSLSDEIDDFSGFSDDFSESDLIQDDEVEASAESVAANEELSIAVDESINDAQDDENSFNSLFADADFGEEDALERAEEKKDEFGDDVGLSDEIDDFSGFSDDFSESDLIQDDEAGALAESVSANEELPIAVDESINDVQDDENSFNSLFADADFSEEDALERAVGKKDEFGDDASLSEIDDFFQLGEDTNDFSVQAEDAQATVTEKSPTQGVQEVDFLLPDFDITADTEISDTGADVGIKEDEFSDVFGTDFLNENETVQTFDPETLELKSADKEEITESKPNQTVDTSLEDVESARLSPFEFEQEDLKKQLENAENKFKKAKRYGYLAMGFGAVALSAAAGLGVMTYGAKTEVSRLTEAVTTLEANLAKSAANSPSEEIDAMRNSVVSLNKQVDGFITELKGNSQFPADLLNNKVPNIVAKQDMVSKALDMLQVKVGNLEGKISSAPSVVEPPKVEAAPEPATAPVKEDNVHEIVSTKTAPEHEQVKNVEKHDDPHDLKVVSPHEHAKEVAMHEPASTKKEAVQEHAPVKEKIPHEQAPTKEKSTSETAPVKLKPQTEAVAAKPVVSEKVAVEQKPVKVIKQAVIGKWGVNLVAFKQEWFAKSKAAEFARLGVFAEVIPVHEKNITMYRLRVGGFKTKAEANSNTAKIKQALNLDSVWVSDN